MSRIRLHVPHPLTPGEPVTLDATQAHYLAHVMRLGPDESLTLFNGRGGEYTARLERLERRVAICRIESFSPVDREMPCRTHIVQAACRAEKIETVLQKGTELGAASFQIVHSERATLRLNGDRRRRKLERWRKIIIEAAEQCGRTRLPSLQWREHILETQAPGIALALHPDARAAWPDRRAQLARATEVCFAIGPEGGWSAADIRALMSKGFGFLRFGPRVMRTETAAPALLAAMQAILPDSPLAASNAPREC